MHSTFQKKTLGNVLLLVSIFTFMMLSAQAQVIDSTWYRPRQLINSPMPPVNGTTIQNQKIDSSFFKEKVVVLAFGNLVNVASLKEIEVLNHMESEFKNQPFKILGVMPNAKQDVIDFNSLQENAGMGYSLRMSFQLPVMEYPVMATCDERNPDNTLHVACDNVVKDYLIGGYPVICLIDKKGVVRYVHVGAPPKDKMDQWYDVVTKQVNTLLKEL